MTVFKDTPSDLVVDGQVTQFGLFREPFRQLNLADVAVPGVPAWLRRFRLKQWQHFAVVSKDFLMAFAVVDTQYLASSFCYVLDRKTGKRVEHHSDRPGCVGSVSQTLWHEDFALAHGGYEITIGNRLDEGRHRARVAIAEKRGTPAITADLEALVDLTKNQPLIVVLPISENRPLHTHKMLCPVQGSVTVGDREYTLDAKTDVVLIDVQKTYYPFDTQWMWATCGGYDADGHLLGLNLVQNMITDDEQFNENGLWADGRLSMWGAARFTVDKSNILGPWRVRTTDGRCDLTFTPQGERAGKINLGVIKSDYHQPYGVFNGTVVDDDGRSFELRDFFGVTELHIARF